MKNKKILKICGIILIVLIAIVAIYYFAIHFDGFLNQENKMSQSEIRDLLRKGNECSNYSYGPKVPEKQYGERPLITIKTYVKDNIEKIVSVADGSPVTWIDYDNHERIDIYLGEYKIVNNDYNQKKSDPYFPQVPDEFYDKQYYFENLGEKKINGRDTIVINEWEIGPIKLLADSKKTYIDKETGVVIKVIYYDYVGFKCEVRDRNVEFGKVTDEDVKKPNLDEYKDASEYEGI